MPGTPTITAFNGLTPPWSLASLDANFVNTTALLASLNNYSVYYVDTGAANAYVITVAAGQTLTLSAGASVEFRAINANTGASTLNANGTGVVSLTNRDGSALSAGQILAGMIVRAVYNGTSWQITNLSMSVFLGTSQATTSGTSKDFTVPTTSKKVTLSLVGVSTTGTDTVMVQLGTGGGIETSNYLGTVNDGDTAAQNLQFTSSFADNTGSAAIVRHGTFTLTLADTATNTWACTFGIGFSNLAGVRQGYGTKALAAAITTVRLTTFNGTNTFDAGLANVTWEF